MGRKSAKIADRKGAADKARGQLYTRALKDVFKASKGGSTDLSHNFLLKVAVERARKLNVPKDNIERAIKKGQGSDAGGYYDVNYEGYGPGGIAIFVEASTDNPTRTIGNVRNYFKKCDGTVGASGCLEFVFNRIASFKVPAEGIDEDEFTLSVIDAGVEEVERVDDHLVLSSPMPTFGAVQEKLQELGITPDEASLIRVPLTKKQVSDEAVLEEFDKLVGLLEDDDDVVAVFDNLEEE